MVGEGEALERRRESISPLNGAEAGGWSRGWRSSSFPFNCSRRPLAAQHRPPRLAPGVHQYMDPLAHAVAWKKISVPIDLLQQAACRKDQPLSRLHVESFLGLGSTRI